MKKNEFSISAGDHSRNYQASIINIINEINAPSDIIDQKVEDEIGKLRKSRFFNEFDKTRYSLRLGQQLVKGKYLSASDEVRGRGLAWCARILSRSENLDQAKEFLETAKNAGDSPEIKMAEAFIISQEGNKTEAFRVLADINTNTSRSACLMIVAYHEGAKSALEWMNESGYTVNDLDSDGKHYLLNQQLQLGHWDEAVQTAGCISTTDLTETPSLHHLLALTKLIITVPIDFRAVVITQVPFEVRNYPLASTPDKIEARRSAHKHFLDAVEIEKQLDCTDIARLDDEYALWLELRDPAQLEHGKKRLESKLEDQNTRLGVIHYALQFGIKLNLDELEKEINQHIAMQGGMTMDAAIARYAIAFTKPTHGEIANYLTFHRDQLAKHIDLKLIQFRQIEMFSRAGLIEQANEILKQLISQGLPHEEERNLRRIISESKGYNPVDSLKTQYETTDSLEDLFNLVAELEERQLWNDLGEYSRKLFYRTQDVRHAERLVNALNNANRSKDIVELLEANVDLLTQSRNLKMAYAWSLYYEGRLLESRTVLAGLKEDSSNYNYRTLQIYLGITMGDWNSLLTYVADEYQNRYERSAQDLMSAAQLSVNLGSNSHYTKDLVFEAVAKAGNDADILVAAYFIAITAGWEDDQQVFQWLERAAELSGNKGPLKRGSLKDILEQKPEWDRRESETWQLLAKGQIPIFIAAKSLNRSLIDLTILPSLSNLTESDPRRRSPISAYSGKRVPMKFDLRGKKIALDATALLTLSFLGILDVTIDAFETVYIPHSTLRWLFEELQKASFHQPSRIAEARKIRDLLSEEMIEKFTPSTIMNCDLSNQVGDELAALIAEAAKVREDDDTQYIVVRSSPVHRLSILMEEDADLSAYAHVLSSCLAVVEKLRHRGQLTAEEVKRARVYLQMHEKPWPNQPEIADGAVLYLDSLAITYLLHLRLLGKLKAAGFKAVVSPRVVYDTNALILYEGISNEVKNIIEQIRSSLNSRIESGHVRVGSRHSVYKEREEFIPEHPTVGIVALASCCDGIIVDDRFINQNINLDDENTPVLSSLDILDSLMASGVISNESRLEYRTRLRRAGYFFVPVDDDELYLWIKATDVVDGQVVETAELKAIRESVLRVRMSDWLQLPNEATWLDITLKTFVQAIRRMWENDTNIDQVIARSNWLVRQIDIRGWAHRLLPEKVDNIVRIGRGVQISLLLTPPTDVQQSTVDAYWKWVDERILTPIMDEFPELYEWIVKWHKEWIVRIVETGLSEGGEL